MGRNQCWANVISGSDQCVRDYFEQRKERDVVIRYRLSCRREEHVKQLSMVSSSCALDRFECV